MVLKTELFKHLVLPLEQIFPAGMNPSPPEPDEPREQENSLNPSIVLELNFSGGLLSLTIEELLQLTKTKSIEKPLQISRPIKILIQERTVGIGELVEIGGRYAVVVVELRAAV